MSVSNGSKFPHSQHLPFLLGSSVNRTRLLCDSVIAVQQFNLGQNLLSNVGSWRLTSFVTFVLRTKSRTKRASAPYTVVQYRFPQQTVFSRLTLRITSRFNGNGVDIPVSRWRGVLKVATLLKMRWAGPELIDWTGIARFDGKGLVF